MEKSNIEIKLNVNSKNGVRKIEKATLAANKLQKALNELKEIEIGINVVSVESKWWNFWS